MSKTVSARWRSSGMAGIIAVTGPLIVHGLLCRREGLADRYRGVRGQYRRSAHGEIPGRKAEALRAQLGSSGC